MSHKAAKRQRQRERADVDRFLIRALELLQAEWRARIGAERERWGRAASPCSTCAIQPSTNGWRGQAHTALLFVEAMYREAPFYCHDGAPYSEATGWMVDPEGARLCAAAALFLGVPREERTAILMRAVRGAMAEVWGAAIPDSEAYAAAMSALVAAAAGPGEDHARAGAAAGR